MPRGLGNLGGNSSFGLINNVGLTTENLSL